MDVSLNESAYENVQEIESLEVSEAVWNPVEWFQLGFKECPYCSGPVGLVSKETTTYQRKASGETLAFRVWECSRCVASGRPWVIGSVTRAMRGVKLVLARDSLVLWRDDIAVEEAPFGADTAVFCERGHWATRVKVGSLGRRWKVRCLFFDTFNFTVCDSESWIGMPPAFNREGGFAKDLSKARVLAAFARHEELRVKQVAAASGLSDGQALGVVTRLLRAKVPLIEVSQTYFRYPQGTERAYKLNARGRYWLSVYQERGGSL